MQIAGKKCGICEQDISFVLHGTFCARCETPLHKECLIERNGICPFCVQPLEPSEKHYHYSKLCSRCGTLNTPSKNECRKCGNTTRWDTEKEYDAFRKEVNAGSPRMILGGVIHIITALIITAIFTTLIFTGVIHFRLKIYALFIFPIVYLAARGVKRVRDGVIMRRFE